VPSPAPHERAIAVSRVGHFQSCGVDYLGVLGAETDAIRSTGVDRRQSGSQRKCHRVAGPPPRL